MNLPTGIGIFLGALLTYLVVWAVGKGMSIVEALEGAAYWLLGTGITTLGVVLLLTTAFGFGLKVSATKKEEAMERGKERQAGRDYLVEKNK